MRVVAYLSLANLIISHEFEQEAFPSIFDPIVINGEEFEVMSVDRLDLDVVAINVSRLDGGPWQCEDWCRLELEPGHEHQPIDVIKELYL